MPENHPLQLLRFNEVMDLVGLRRTKIYELIGENGFPKPVKIGPRASRWRRQEVEDWIKALAPASEQ